MKLFKLLVLISLFLVCNSYKTIAQENTIDKIVFPLKQNDSIEKFIAIDNKISKRVEQYTSYNNPVTQHFTEYISNKNLKSVVFKEWRRNIYIEFSLNQQRQITHLATNTTSTKLDKKLKKGFRKLDSKLIEIKDYDSRYKYTLVIIQEIDGKPVIKCSEKAIGFIPPVYRPCKKEKTYHSLNNCNHNYISNYMNNHVDLTQAETRDINYNHKILPKFIIDENGEVVAAKIESQNKELLEAYYKTLKKLPKAEKPAMLDGKPYYFGYNFPTTIATIIRNNNYFKEFYFYDKDSGRDIYSSIKDFIIIKHIRKERKERAKIFRVGF